MRTDEANRLFVERRLRRAKALAAIATIEKIRSRYAALEAAARRDGDDDRADELRARVDFQTRRIARLTED